MRLFSMLLALLVFAVPSFASYAGEKVYIPDSYPVGYSYDGWTKQADGAYYNGSSYAQLIEYKVYTLSSCRCYYYWQKYYYWKPLAYPQKLAFTDDWRKQAVKLLDNQAERDAFERTMKALGLNYDQSYQQQSVHYSPGQSSYYEYKRQDIWSPIDLNLWQAQEGRIAETLVKAVEKNNEGRQQSLNIATQEASKSQLIRDLTIQNTRLVETIMRGDKPAASITTEIRRTGPPEKMPGVEDAPLKSRFAPIEKKYNCNGCHAEKEIAFRLENFDSLTSKERQKVYTRLNAKDDTHMPKGGPTLTEDEMALFFR